MCAKFFPQNGAMLLYFPRIQLNVTIQSGVARCVVTVSVYGDLLALTREHGVREPLQAQVKKRWAINELPVARFMGTSRATRKTSERSPEIGQQFFGELGELKTEYILGMDVYANSTP